MNDVPWREQTDAESELLRVVLLADFPEREKFHRLRESRVRLECSCGCGSLDFEDREGLPGLPPGWHIELNGRTGTGESVTVAIRLREDDLGRILCLEITQESGSEGKVTVLPESMRQFRVTHIKDGVVYSVLRDRTVLEEARARGE